jgi:DNA-binding NarL/FixJ family response regulator
MKRETPRKPRILQDQASPVRVLIADDHPLFRQGLATVLKHAGITVAGEASTGHEALTRTKSLEPDIVILDVRMPDMDGLQALKAIKAARPRTAVVILTTYQNADYLWTAVLNGAAAYLLKDAPGEELVGLIHRVSEGENVLDTRQIRTMMQENDPEQTPAAVKKILDDWELTDRERDILQAIANGLRNAEIAKLLDIEVATVKSHSNHIFKKMNVSDRTQAALWAIRHGLIQHRGGSGGKP